jgi:hypothetical protein
MSRSFVKVHTVSSATFLGGVGVSAAYIFGPFNISNYKEYSVTVQLCASHGIGFGIFTAPVNELALYTCATGNLTTITSGIHTPVTLNMINNNQHWLAIRASATAVNSASLVNVVFTAIERDM